MKALTTKHYGLLCAKMKLVVLSIPGLLLFGCGPSQAELDAQATRIAVQIFATLTAAAPTPTSTPTATFTSTATLTPSVTPTPKPTNTRTATYTRTATPIPSTTPIPTITSTPTPLPPPVQVTEANCKSLKLQPGHPIWAEGYLYLLEGTYSLRSSWYTVWMRDTQKFVSAKLQVSIPGGNKANSMSFDSGKPTIRDNQDRVIPRYGTAYAWRTRVTGTWEGECWISIKTIE